VIFDLIQLLSVYLGHVPAVFLYSSTRMAMAAITSLLVCVLAGPRFIAMLSRWKAGQPIRTADSFLLGELHAKKQNTPTMGGVLILVSLLVSLFLYMNLRHAFTLILFLTLLSLGFLGALDDLAKLRQRHSRGLSGRLKLALQVCFTLALMAYLLIPSVTNCLQLGNWFPPPTAREVVGGQTATLSLSDYVTRLYLPFVKHPLWSFAGWGLPLFGILVIGVVAGTSNAVNLADGLDGLAVGLLTLAAATLAGVAFVSNHSDLAAYLGILYIEGASEIAVFLSACVGACLGFLWYNGHPAQVFMGDTGSLALGGALGVSALLLAREFLLALVGGVFVAETVSVMLQVASYRWRNRRRIFLCTPLHHHFEYKGWPETKVVIRFWIIGLLLAIIGIASLKFQ
jgi:phospho-N-acetylmuramoyl-pentapeptide-transferase